MSTKELILLSFAILALSLLCYYAGIQHAKTTCVATKAVVVDTLYAIDYNALKDYSKK